MSKRAIRLLALLVLLVGAAAGGAEAAELKVLSTGAMRAVLQELGPAFEKASGDKLVIEFATAAKVEEKVAAADDEIDVAILTKPRFDRLVRTARMAGGGSALLARVPIGLAVRKGAPHPDIGSVDGFKQALNNAKSIAYADPASGATSGIHLAQLLEKLGIAAALKPKIHLVSAAAGESPPRVGEVVQRGDAEIGMQPISELTGIDGIDIVGPLPAELQSPDLVFMAGLPIVSKEPLGAKALIDFLAAPEAASVYQAKGMEPK